MEERKLFYQYWADLTVLQVILVTGSNTGVGKELAQILYARDAHATSWRSKEKSQKTINDIRATAPHSQGRPTLLRLDPADLDAVKAAAQEFARWGHRLHMLFHNAGVAFPETASRIAQDIEPILSPSLNLGNLDTDLWRTQGRLTVYLVRKTILYPSVYGTYTCLFAEFSPELTLESKVLIVSLYNLLLPAFFWASDH